MISPSLAPRLEALRTSSRLPEPILAEFARHLAEADDGALYRMNPLAWAPAHQATEVQAIDLFLHATRRGILDFDWGVLCPGCGRFMNTQASLRSLATPHTCAMCLIPTGGSVDDGIEVAFTVNAAIRHLRFHDPDSVDYTRDAGRLNHSQHAGRGRQISAAISQVVAASGRVKPGETVEADATTREGGWLVLFPEPNAGARFTVTAGGPAQCSIDLSDRTVVAGNCGPGNTRFRVTNRNGDSTGFLILPDPKTLGPMPAPPPDEAYFSGRRLLSSQTFRDLFRAESLPTEIGIKVRTLTILFTDLKGSTQLYSRIGDIQAFDLVRQHFNVLRDIVSEQGGAVVKTIGDAVMAAFHDPLGALSAAIQMREQVAKVGNGELLLKIGLHEGPCIAVELNEQLDYFGQTVNVAARVQNLAGAGEIVLTEEVFSSPQVAQLALKNGLEARHSNALLKGIDAPVPVVSLS